MIEGHGDDGWKYSSALLADFSSNVFYGALDAGLREHLREVIDGVTHYPEAGAVSLQNKIATAHGVESHSLLVTNGATEAIYLIAHAFRGMPVTIVAPTFSEYADACTLEGAEVRYISWEELIAEPPRGMVFICNPNNPTGKAVALRECLQNPGDPRDTLFVIDESYIDFTQSTETLIGSTQHNVLILRSLTKTCRIPGLRIGFVTGPEHHIRRLRERKMPWSVNRLALEAGDYIFSHREDFKVPVAALQKATAQWRRELAEAAGWRVGDTDTHYFLMETPQAFTAAQLKLHLVNKYGLLIRDAANFKGLSPHHFRIACQSPEHNQLLTEALRECSRTGI